MRMAGGDPWTHAPSLLRRLPDDGGRDRTGRDHHAERDREPESEYRQPRAGRHPILHGENYG